MKKKKWWIVLIALLIVVILGFGGYQVYRFPDTFRGLSDKSVGGEEVSRLAEQMREKEDKRILVAYFSYSGTTKGVADAISEKTGADLFEIKTQKEYSNVYTESNREIRRNEKPELADTVEQMESYDIVFAGYPNWNADLPMPLYTFFETYDFAGKTIIPFVTHGGSGFSDTVDTIKELEPDAEVVSEGLSVSRNDVAKAQADVKEWTDALLKK